MKSKLLRVNEDIVLRGCEPQFAEPIFQSIQEHKTHLREWLSWVDAVQSVEDTQAFLKDAHRLNIGGQQLNTWIFYKGEFCGSISFAKIDKTHQFGEIGYWLSESYTGKGIVTQSCERMIRYGFEKINLNKIVIRVASTNYPSLKVPQRLGFQQEGVARASYRLRDTFHDLVLFGLLKSEWESK